MKALVTGATGFIGRHLVKRLQGAVVLTRDPAKARRILGEVTAIRWDPLAGPPPAEAFAGVDTVFNLMGDPVVEGRWNPVKLKAIRDSRVIGTRHLIVGMAAAPTRPRVLVSASGVGYYGNRGDLILDEGSAPGEDTMAGVCKEWEAEARVAAAAGMRVVCIRTGIALGRTGGGLAQMLLPFRLGLGGRLGSGRQWMSWIHLDDLVALYLAAADREDLSGTLNGVAPEPVTNADFTRALGDAVNRPTIFPVPEFVLRLAFGGVAEVMLGSQRVLPRTAEQAGFTFAHPKLAPALKAILAG